MGFYKENNVYNNEELTFFMDSLESKYNIINYRDKYKHSVNFSENKDVPFHQWFKYREGFSGAMIKDLIEDSKIEIDQIVLDPFSGSGTTPVVAQELGYSSIGIDVNPMSAFICKVKLSSYSKLKLNILKETIPNVEFDISTNELDGYETQYKDVLSYFSTRNFRALMAIKKIIDNEEDKDNQEILKVAYLSIIESVSDRKKDGNGLKKRPSTIEDVCFEFVRKVIEICSDLYSKGQTPLGDSIFGSAMNLTDIYKKSKVSLNKKVGTVIFSPPYPNSFDYFETYKLELVLGDFVKGIRDIKTLRNNAVRSFISVSNQSQTEKYIDYIAEEIEFAIPIKEDLTGKKDVRTRKVPNMIKGYFDDMRTVIRSCHKLLNIGSKVYIVVDQSSYLGKIVPSDLMLAHLAESEGFEVKYILNCRNSRTSTQQLQQYPYLKTGLRESIVILEKI